MGGTPHNGRPRVQRGAAGVSVWVGRSGSQCGRSGFPTTAEEGKPAPVLGIGDVHPCFHFYSNFKKKKKQCFYNFVFMSAEIP